MKAIQISRNGGPEVLEYIERPDPVPAADEVLVRAAAVGVAKPDYLMRSGKYRWAPPLPSIIGNEMAGTVEAFGADITDLAVGQKVLVWGYEQGCYVDVGAYKRHRIQPLPDGVDLDAAVSIPNYLVSYALLHETTARAPKAVYVDGAAGGIGTAVIQLGSHAGMQVIGGASSDEKCAFAAKTGAAHTINYSREAVVDRLLALTDGRGVDLFLDSMIGPAFPDKLKALATHGTIVSYNALQGLPEQETFAAMRAMAAKCLGVRCFSFHGYDHDPEGTQRLLDAVLPLFANGAIRPPLHARLPLAEARQAHELLDARAIMGKLVLVP
jgi:NADPH2:quinone reductase